MSKIVAEIKYSLLSFFRNKSNLFWTFGFPIVMFLLMGFMYSMQGGQMTLNYVDNDHSQGSAAFIDALNSTGAVQLMSGSSTDLAQSLKDGKIGAYLEIPAGFGKDSSSTAQVKLYYDKTQQSSMALISIVQQVADAYNMRLAGAQEHIDVQPQDVATTAVKPLDFVLPGIIGMALMMSSITSTVSVNVKNRARGVFRKLATTPMSRLEWNISKMVSQSIIALMSVVVSLAVAWVVFGLHPNIDIFTIAFILLGTMTFVGLGMIFAAVLKSEESAGSVSSMICLPLMFLSGTFFSIDLMPSFLKIVAQISPLTYLNYGLRDVMISGNYDDALTDLAILAVIGIVFFAIGVALMKWKEE
ncbi:MAG TPA: ABC transporter permease [Methanocellaceae archaeon]|jgi:ABC-2 type transport system permease protein